MRNGNRVLSFLFSYLVAVFAVLSFKYYNSSRKMTYPEVNKYYNVQIENYTGVVTLVSGQSDIG